MADKAIIEEDSENEVFITKKKPETNATSTPLPNRKMATKRKRSSPIKSQR